MADEKLIFPIGFDLEGGVEQAKKDWKSAQSELANTFKSNTIGVDVNISEKALNKLYSQFESLIKSVESKSPQIKLKMPNTVDFEQEINRLKVQLKSINLGELTDDESKDLYLYIRQLEALAKALKEVNKQEQLRQANNPANKALQEARAQEKLTRAKANDALAEQRRAKIATETARQNEINNRSAQRGAVIAEQKRAATARAEQAELRLTQAKERSAKATQKQNTAYAQQSTYLQRLAQRMIAYASVTQAMQFLRNIREVTAEFELQRVALGSIIGDLNTANTMFEQIKAAAVKSPFQIKELVSYTKQLAAYKIETDELFETTQKLADISAGLGVGMERLVLAYGQIRATGYLRASEVRQLTEAGIPIIEELAKKMSDLRGETVSAAEVMGMISERAISFGMVKEVFDDMTSAGGMFYKMQEKQAETLAGQISNLKDSFAIMYDEIGRSENVNSTVKSMIGLVKSLAENWQSIANLIKYTAIQYGVMYGATLFIPKLLRSTELMAKSQDAFARASKMSAAATQRHSAILAFSAKQTRLYAYWMRQAAMAHTMFGRGLKQIMAMLAGGGWIGIAIGFLTAMTSLIISAVKESKRLNNELSKIGTEGAMQAEQSVRNFEYLAKTIRESADGSEKQTKALAELKRSYGDLLPTQDKEIKALVQEKSNYDALIKSIREKINLQIHEQKLNTLASEYGGRLSKQEGKLQETLKDIGLSPSEIGRIFTIVREQVEKGVTLGVEDFAKILTDATTLSFERVKGSTVVSAGLFKGVDVRDFDKYVKTLGEYNEQIELVGGSLDHLDDKGKNLSDTFNTWQKELASITEGKNLKGEGIRIFDDETIAQTPKLTSALEKAAEKYKKLKKEKVQVDKALKSEGAKADKQTYAQLEERLGKINEGMSGLYDFLKKYGGIDLIKEGGKSELAILQEELQLHEKIYAKYKEYRKYMSAEQAKAKVEDYFGNTIKSLKYTPSFEKSGYQNVLTQYQDAIKALLAKAKNETEKGAIKKVLLELGFKIDNINWDDEKDKIEKELKRLSDNLSRTKTAKEFFDRMLGLTGDKQLSATLTMSVYGTTGDDLKQRLIAQVQGAFAGQDLSEAINTDLKSIDLSALRKIYEELPEDFQEKQKTAMQQVLNMLEKQQQDISSSYAKLLMEYDEMAQKRVTITNKAAQDIKTIEDGLQAHIDSIRKDKNITDKDAEISKAQARANEVIKAIKAREALDLKKLTPEYIRFFSSINAMTRDAANKTRTELRRALFEAFEKGAMSAEELRKELKAIDTQFNKLNQHASAFVAYIGGGFDSMLKKLQDSADEMDAIGARMMKLPSIEQMDKGDANFVDKMLNVFGNKGQQSLSDLVTSFNGDMTQMGQAVQQVGGQMQGMFGGAMGAIALIDVIVKAIGQTISAIQNMIDELNSLRTEDNQIGGWFRYISDFDKYVQRGWESLKSGNPADTVAATFGSWISIIRNVQIDKIKKLDEEIETQQDLLDDLSYQYERLQKASEESFGTEYIQNYNNQLSNLNAQLDAYQKQLDAERGKGKKTDEDKVKDYLEQIRDAQDAIDDMYGTLSEHFLGQDLSSAARDFANAWLEAYKAFSNTTDAMKEKFQDMIQNMIVESLLAKVMERALEPVFTMIDEMGDADFYNPSFWDELMGTMAKATEDGVVGAENVMSMLEQMGVSIRGFGGNLTGISRDIATASEESILGLAAGINTQNFYISQVPPKLDVIIGLLQGGNLAQGSAITLQDLVTIQNQHLSYLPSIAQHTADTVAECKQIVAETRRTADALERVIKPRGTQATYTVNTSL